MPPTCVYVCVIGTLNLQVIIKCKGRLLEYETGSDPALIPRKNTGYYCLFYFHEYAVKIQNKMEESLKCMCDKGSEIKLNILLKKSTVN